MRFIREVPAWTQGLLRSPQDTLHPKLPRLLPRPFRRGEGWGEGLLGVVYPAVLAVSSMGESKFALSCVWGTAGLRLCADSIRRRLYPVRAGGTTGVAGMSAMPQRPGEAQGQSVPGVADGAYRLEARVAGDGGAPVRVSGVCPVSTAVRWPRQQRNSQFSASFHSCNCASPGARSRARGHA